METPRKFITAVINLRGVSTNKTIIYLIAMQTYKELITCIIVDFPPGFNYALWNSALPRFREIDQNLQILLGLRNLS